MVAKYIHHVTAFAFVVFLHNRIDAKVAVLSREGITTWIASAVMWSWECCVWSGDASANQSSHNLLHCDKTELVDGGGRMKRNPAHLR
eukprot:10021379-Ditylum_brightwellii.AAC.1